MKNELMMFEGKEIEVFEFEGQILFNPKHVAECLDISDVNSSIRKFNDNQVVKLTNSKMHNMQFRKLHNTGENFLTESGVYKLIFKSKKEEAERFQDWISDEVLPQIRQTGAYITNNADPDKLREKASEIESLDTVNKTIEILTPFLDNAGIDEKAKLLTAKTIYKKAGIELPLEIEEKEHFFDTVQIATKLNIYSKTNNPAFMAVCEIIKKLDIKEEEKLIVLANKKGWNGTTTKYSQSVIDKISKWIEENKRPTKIQGEKKNFYIVYKEAM
ncbi:prophage antirepressor-related protein [Clostridioides difficile]|uniref:BRO-N domain-containing protein n=1 Tax=Clostridioides difficile TaxID=1496 RepID=UPI000E520D43|nr:Bro-N domain-containing protein [Clostridioides difficile]AXU76079.1 prophage antirepressor-related protein [Clostridioides difficile]